MLSLADFLAATAAVALGALVQASTGVGAGFIIVPFLAWIDYRLVPGPVVLASIALSVAMSLRERADIDRQNLPAVLLGLVPGTLAGAFALSRIPADRLGALFGTMLLLALAISVSGLRVTMTRASAVLGGLVSGAMGASSGFGAPPLALLYQHQSGARIRATLAVIYTAASLLILTALGLFDLFGAEQLLLGTLLIPGFLLGYLLSGRLAAHLEHHDALRPAVLVISGIAGLLLIWRSVG